MALPRHDRPGAPPHRHHRPVRRRALPRAVGRAGGPRDAGRGAAVAPHRPAAGRADQPPRPGRHPLAGAVSVELPGCRAGGDPRPPLPRRDGLAHPRAGSGDTHPGGLRGRLHGVPGREAAAVRAAPGGAPRPGALPQAAGGGHRPHPRPGGRHRIDRQRHGQRPAQALRQEGGEEGEGPRGQAGASDGRHGLDRAARAGGLVLVHPGRHVPARPPAGGAGGRHRGIRRRGGALRGRPRRQGPRPDRADRPQRLGQVHAVPGDRGRPGAAVRLGAAPGARGRASPDPRPSAARAHGARPLPPRRPRPRARGAGGAGLVPVLAGAAVPPHGQAQRRRAVTPPDRDAGDGRRRAAAAGRAHQPPRLRLDRRRRAGPERSSAAPS